MKVHRVPAEPALFKQSAAHAHYRESNYRRLYNLKRVRFFVWELKVTVAQDLNSKTNH